MAKKKPEGIIFYNDYLEAERLKYIKPEWYEKYLTTCEYIFDLRCWKKHRKDITYNDVLFWIYNGCTDHNSGHAVFLIKLLLDRKVLKLPEIVTLIMRNNSYIYADEIGTGVWVSEDPDLIELREKTLIPLWQL